MLRLVVFALLVAPLAAQPPSPPPFPPHHGFSLIQVNKDWDNALTHCRSIGGKLAMVDDASENSQIVNLLTAASIDRAWIGLNDKGTEATFTWTREDSSVPEIPLGAYAPWGTGQPAADTSYHDCVHLLYSGKWASRTCFEEKAFVCEGVAPPPSPFEMPALPNMEVASASSLSSDAAETRTRLILSVR